MHRTVIKKGILLMAVFSLIVPSLKSVSAQSDLYLIKKQPQIVKPVVTKQPEVVVPKVVQEPQVIEPVVPIEPIIKQVPFVKVLSPNGGETYKTGEKLSIKWTSNSEDGRFTIFLNPKSNSQNRITVAKNIRLTRDYKWTIPGGIEGDWRVQVVRLNDGVKDASDNFFHIVEPRYVSPLDGLESTNPPTQTPIAIVVDNSVAGRNNQSGLEEASIVYESLAEGGVTRFLAVYDGHPNAVVGPIRSARPYSIDWAEEYDGALLHVGGSPDAMIDLQTNSQIFSIDELTDPYKTIWRDQILAAPHNAYTSVNKVINTLGQAGYSHPYTGSRFVFQDPDATKGNVTKLIVDYSTLDYKTRFLFNRNTNLYERYEGGNRQGNIAAANVVVQYVNSNVIDSEGRIGMDTQTAGKSIVFRDGKAIIGHWRFVNGETKFYDLQQNEVRMNRGQTWIEIVPNTTPIYTTESIY